MMITVQTVLLLVSTLLTAMAFFSGKQGSFWQVYEFEINTFRSPHFTLGIMYQEWDSEHEGIPCKVDELIVGIVLFQWRVEFKKALEGDEEAE